MLDHLICYNISSQIANDGMNISDNSPLLIGCEALRFDVRINQTPLASPVVTHSAMPLNTPAFHTIGPIYIRTHSSQNRINITGIECLVDLCEKFLIRRFHCIKSLESSQIE